MAYAKVLGVSPPSRALTAYRATIVWGPLSTRLTATAVVAVAYAIAALALHDGVGSSVHELAIVAVGFAGYHVGRRIGAIAGALSMPFLWATLTLGGHAMVWDDVWVLWVVLVAVGAVLGHLRALAQSLEARAREAEQRRAESELAERSARESEARFRAAFQGNSAALCVTTLDDDYTFVEVNEAFSRLTGYECSELIARSPAELGLWSVDGGRADFRRRLAETGGIRDRESTVTRRSGEIVPVRFSIEAIDFGGRPCALGTLIDVTDQTRVTRLLDEQRRILEAIANEAPLPTVLAAIAQLIERQSEGQLSALRLLSEDGTKLRPGAAPSIPEPLWREMSDISVGPAARPCGVAAYSKQHTVVRDLEQEVACFRCAREGAPYGVRACSASPILSSQGETLGLVTLAFRESRAPTTVELEAVAAASRLAAMAIERQRAREALERLALRDPLTGLANRSLFRDLLGEAIATASPIGVPVGLLSLDIDRFKEINDAFGHLQGDQLLCAVGGRIAETVGDRGVVCRLGGDQFGVLLSDATSVGAVQATTLAVLSAIAAPIAVGTQVVYLDASVGIALYPEHGADADTLMRRTDVAMYSAKRAGTRYSFYSSAEDPQSQGRVTLASQLREGIERDELVLHYQPKVALPSGELVGVEALVRWQHPQRGLVPPSEFIPIAEQTGLIAPLTLWVLRRAVEQAALWRAAGVPTRISVNLSPRNLRDRSLPGQVEQLLRGAGVPPSDLALEVTEESVMLDFDRVVKVLCSLRELGVKVSIDDMGSGYSAFGYLAKLPADEVKIDKSFVLGMRDPGKAAIVRAIIDVGHTYGFEVVAEGVETEAVWHELVTLGCDSAQGFYMGRPLPGADLGRWLAEWHARIPSPHIKAVPVSPLAVLASRATISAFSQPANE